MKALLLSLSLLITATTAIGDDGEICALISCPTPLCANPVTPEGKCCPSCENSLCKFKGCVQFLGSPGSETVQWKPDGCTTCTCVDDKTICGAMGCLRRPSLDPCIDRPTITSPTECCVTCDYGTPKDECVVVRDDNRYTYRLGLEEDGSSCSVMLTFHLCDKRGYMDNNGQRFECKPVVSQLSMKLSDVAAGSCGALTELAYNDVEKCVAVRNDDLDVGCDIYVE